MGLSIEIRYEKYAQSRLASVSERQHLIAMRAVRNLLVSEARGNPPRRYENPDFAGLPGAEDLLFFAIFGVRIVYRRDTACVTIISIEIDPVEPPLGGGGIPIKGLAFDEELRLVE